MKNSQFSTDTAHHKFIKEKNMKKIVALGVILTGMVGCTNNEDLKKVLNNIDLNPIIHTFLNGTWVSECAIEGVNSFISTIKFNSGTGSIDSTIYSDTTCDINSTVSMVSETFTYTFGNTVTVDGSIDGVTQATEIDLTDTTSGANPAGVKSYDIYALSSESKLYIGDETGANDGTTKAKRPIQLTNIAFTKQ